MSLSGARRPSWRRAMRRDFSWSALTAGIVVILVSYAGPFAIIAQAGIAGGLSSAQFASWVWAISIATGLTCIGLSLLYRVPLLTAWSTPAAALLVTALPGTPWSDAIGTFLVVGGVIVVLGVTGFMDRLMRALTPALASALLAGILLRFGLDAFRAAGSAPLLALCVLAAYLVARRFTPRFAVPFALLTGLLIAAATFGFEPVSDAAAFVWPSLTAPTFSLASIVGLGIPLLLVTISGQYVPGFAALREAGYTLNTRVPTAVLGMISMVFAPLGAHGLNPAAITIGICAGAEAHPDKDRRYVAGVLAGVAYVLVGLFAGALLMFIKAVPTVLILLVAGLALLASISGSLLTALSDERSREPAAITFLVTASGVQLFGVASAFWGIVAGMLALAVTRRVRH